MKVLQPYLGELRWSRRQFKYFDTWNQVVTRWQISQKVPVGCQIWFTMLTSRLLHTDSSSYISLDPFICIEGGLADFSVNPSVSEHRWVEILQIYVTVVEVQEWTIESVSFNTKENKFSFQQNLLDITNKFTLILIGLGWRKNTELHQLLEGIITYRRDMEGLKAKEKEEKNRKENEQASTRNEASSNGRNVQYVAQKFHKLCCCDLSSTFIIRDVIFI